MNVVDWWKPDVAAAYEMGDGKPLIEACDEALGMDFPEELEQVLNEIGAEALRLVGDDGSRVLIYAEVSEDVDAMFFRYTRPSENKVRCLAEFGIVADAIREAWDVSRRSHPKHCWRGMVYYVEDRKMTARLLYDKDVDDVSTMFEKEERIIEEFLPGMEVIPDDEAGGVELSLPKRSPPWRFW